ncbi:MAG: 3-dehydroquinate synthase [Gammaproteobacteria bacterium]|jgi:3-dehydroquinate synthase|nr:MAG: 3-dehydroquinate synthase [Gammaproteobacteria bacterium]
MSIQQQLTVALGERSYPIYIGTGLLEDSSLLDRHITGSQVAVITNDVLAELALPQLLAALQGCNAQVSVFTLADGEGEKNLANYAAIMDHLIVERHNRTTTLIALGGGVVGDITGFAAATYQRGVNFIQIPTTLLAQVDSSVGGKTAVNHPSGKNLIGAFHQPVAVLADMGLLATLPPREYAAGIAEVVKYGVIAERTFFSWLEENAEALGAQEPQALSHAVAVSCQTKADVVAEDERESGRRAILNFGHTFGHAIEALTGYTEYLHGEAVAIGMVQAADLSARLGLLPWEDARRVRTLLARFELPVAPPALDGKAMLNAMGMDKKVVDGTLRLILARSLGDAVVSSDVPADALMATLNAGEGLCDG